VVISSTSRIVASPNPLAFNSGTYFATAAFSSSTPSEINVAAMVATNDFVTENAMCCPSGFRAPKYFS
jgi:hypothetical protein